jgi:hypothetical protein
MERDRKAQCEVREEFGHDNLNPRFEALTGDASQ